MSKRSFLPYGLWLRASPRGSRGPHIQPQKHAGQPSSQPPTTMAIVTNNNKECIGEGDHIYPLGSSTAKATPLSGSTSHTETARQIEETSREKKEMQSKEPNVGGAKKGMKFTTCDKRMQKIFESAQGGRNKRTTILT